MAAPRILMNCIRMHRRKDNALSGNFFHCLRLIEALTDLHRIDLRVHVDQQTLPYLSQVVSPDHLVVEDRSVNSIGDMEFSIRRAIKQVQPDLYHKPTGQLPLLPIGCRSIWGVADLGYLHLAMGRLQRLYKRLSYRLSARRALRILTVSDSTRQQVIDALHVSPAKVQTVHHGTTAFSTEPEVVSGLPTRYVLTFAHQRHKNVEKVMEAVAVARAAGSDTAIVVVGSLDYRGVLEQVAQTHQITDRVVYTGHVSEGQLRYLYENAVCLAFLSRHEGFGLPVLEAMGAGCPVICSNAFALPEVAGDAAPVFDCDDHRGVAAEIQRMTDNDSYRQSWITKGFANANRFSWKRAAEETISVYEAALQL